MLLVDRLRHRMQAEESYFSQHLLREDLERLERLQALAGSAVDRPAFIAAGLKIGWTPEERRTHELKPALEPLLAAIHERSTCPSAYADLNALDEQITALWQAFESLRMDRLVGCLARVPRPDD